MQREVQVLPPGAAYGAGVVMSKLTNIWVPTGGRRVAFMANHWTMMAVEWCSAITGYRLYTWLGSRCRERRGACLSICFRPRQENGEGVV
jgi:hypothetical protein